MPLENYQEWMAERQQLLERIIFNIPHISLYCPYFKADLR